MPNEETLRDKLKESVPVICRRCGKPHWHKVDEWPPPIYCPACAATASEMTFAQAMDELFGA